jgi:hypothetical protein
MIFNQKANGFKCQLPDYAYKYANHIFDLCD